MRLFVLIVVLLAGCGGTAAGRGNSTPVVSEPPTSREQADSGEGGEEISGSAGEGSQEQLTEGRGQPRGDASTIYNEGLAHYEAGEFPEAAEKFAEVHRLHGDPGLLFNLGRVHSRMGDPDQAMGYYERYLAEANPSPEEAEDVQRRIDALHEIRARQQAQLFMALPSDQEMTSEAESFYMRGIAMYQSESYEAALAAFEAAYRFSRFPEVLFNIAVTYERLERRADAIDFYREYILERPEAEDRGVVEAKIAALRGS